MTAIVMKKARMVLLDKVHLVDLVDLDLVVLDLVDLGRVDLDRVDLDLADLNLVDLVLVDQDQVDLDRVALPVNIEEQIGSRMYRAEINHENQNICLITKSQMIEN